MFYIHSSDYAAAPYTIKSDLQTTSNSTYMIECIRQKVAIIEQRM